STNLSITSYALKGPPLGFEPDVHINACRLVNPPSELRKAFDGRCEGLRKDLRADPAFHQLLAEAQPQIFEAAETKRALMFNTQDHSVHPVEVKVAVACVRGRHRSTAVAEELAKLPTWPEHYDVRLYHRDLSNMDSRDHLRPEGSPDPHNPLHVPSEHHKGADTQTQFSLHHSPQEHEASVMGHIPKPQHIPPEKSGHFIKTQTHAAQHTTPAKLETPIIAQQTPQRNSFEKSQGPVDTQTEHPQHTSLEKSIVPSIVQTQTVQHISPEKVDRPAEAQQISQHSEKPEALVTTRPPVVAQPPVVTQPEPVVTQPAPVVTQPQSVQPVAPERPVTSVLSQTQTPQPISSEKHEAPAATQPQTMQPNPADKPDSSVASLTQTPLPVLVEKHEAATEPRSKVPQHNAPEKSVEAQAPSDSQHISSRP
ncbi:unnamed protein product, partial [Aureobasidium vineae]